MISYDRMHAAAARARMVLLRLGGTGGVLEQAETGAWDDDLSPQQADDLADRLEALTEHARSARAFGGGQLSDTDPVDLAVHMVEEAAATRLPMNRKERFYTGTVLPVLVGSDAFAHLDRLLALCGLDAHVQPGRDGQQDIQFLTEYGFAESVFSEADHQRWPGPTGKDTPDIVLTGPDWLLAIEAKMFHNPNAAALNRQMRDQAALVRSWQHTLGLLDHQVRHVLLLPGRLAERVGPLAFNVVIWEDVLAAYRAVGPAHWVGVLGVALGAHRDLESRGPVFGRNAHDKLTGAEIHAAHGEGTLRFDYLGRSGGLDGSTLQEDIATGRWRTTRYEVRSGPLPDNPNWFSMVEFLARTATRLL
jgi:hypothetical protein